MKQDQIKVVLNHIESNYRVNEWEALGIKLWPILRIRLWYGLAYQAMNVSVEDSIQHQSKFKQIKRLLLSPFNWFFYSLKDFNKTLVRSPKGDIFILGDGVSFTKFQDKYFDKFADSLGIILDKHQIACIRADTTDEYLTPRYRSSFFIQPILDFLNLRSLIEVKFKHPALDLIDYDAVCNYVEQYSQGHIFRKSVVQLRLLKIDRLAKYFEKVLNKGKFKAAMSVCYYSDFGFALNLACKRLGIPSYDLQHGVQGDNHGAYGSWFNLPENGYEVLPNYFLVWSEKEKGSILSWSRNTSNHDAIITGNLLANIWKEMPSDGLKGKKEILSQLPDEHPNILLTLSWDVSSEEHIGNVLTVIKSTQDQYNWLIRLHPSMLNEKETVIKMLNANGIKKYEIDGSTNFPLFSVLELSDFHITHSSTCVIEASYFNVPSMIISEYGWSLLSEQLESKWLTKALIPEEIEKKITEHFEKYDSKPPDGMNSSNDSQEWIKQLIKTFDRIDVSA